MGYIRLRKLRGSVGAIYIVPIYHMLCTVQNTCELTPKEVAAKLSCHHFWCNLTISFQLKQIETNSFSSDKDKHFFL